MFALLRGFLVVLKCSFGDNHHMLASKPNSEGIGTSAYELYLNTLQIQNLAFLITKAGGNYNWCEVRNERRLEHQYQTQKSKSTRILVSCFDPPPSMTGVISNEKIQRLVL